MAGSDQSGSRGRVNTNGDIVYPDGTTAIHDNTTGQTTFIYPDGTTRVSSNRARAETDADGNTRYYAPDGTHLVTYNRDGDYYVYPDGRRVKGSDRSGTRGRVNSKGDIEYPDGTIATHDSATGDIIILRPDGSWVRVDADGNRHYYAPDGSITTSDSNREGSVCVSGSTEIGCECPQGVWDLDVGDLNGKLGVLGNYNGSMRLWLQADGVAKVVYDDFTNDMGGVLARYDGTSLGAWVRPGLIDVPVGIDPDYPEIMRAARTLGIETTKDADVPQPDYIIRFDWTTPGVTKVMPPLENVFSNPNLPPKVREAYLAAGLADDRIEEGLLGPQAPIGRHHTRCVGNDEFHTCLLYTSPSPRDRS